MAGETERWLCSELAKFGLAEENAQYVLSMDDVNDRKEYLQGVLDFSDSHVKNFFDELSKRFVIKSNHNMQVYQKQKDIEFVGKPKSKKKQKLPPNDLSTSSSNQAIQKPQVFQEINGFSTASNFNAEIGVGAKKKTKFVPLFSTEGQAKSVVQLPGRHICECQSAKHKLINNCIQCGRIVCEQEGAGPCVFCGALVCTPETQQLIDSGTKKGEKVRQKLMNGGGLPAHLNVEAESSSLFPVIRHSKQEFEKAVQHRDKLLEFDKNSVRRTQVIDDESDYFATDSNQWLSSEDREKLRKRDEELRKSRHGSRLEKKFTFDFAGRRIIETEDDSAKKMYSLEDSIVQQVHYGKVAAQNTPEFHNKDFQPLKFLETNEPGRSIKQPLESGFKKAVSRIQDKELQEMSDEGMCLSMHQPWASLLVAGIKMHEGRGWYTAHRGRLWIASTAKTPSSDEIKEHENIYRHIYNDASIEFPSSYPTGSLLGCVNVDDCLSQDEYREQFPNGESSSPYVFICSNPRQLIVKFPIKGKHKIYKLEQNIHQAAKKGIR
ncbi:activating signal cointegrator 1-like [Physella acuta]|uniref:activating signal cointegrator 1-like n=1 Tax=Physella acuta TaxID=109671 RepID=UPI0027DD8E07|nr:activating signal cointegrator 1-like [Physella acuta]